LRSRKRLSTISRTINYPLSHAHKSRPDHRQRKTSHRQRRGHRRWPIDDTTSPCITIVRPRRPEKGSPRSSEKAFAPQRFKPTSPTKRTSRGCSMKPCGFWRARRAGDGRRRLAPKPLEEVTAEDVRRQLPSTRWALSSAANAPGSSWPSTGGARSSAIGDWAIRPAGALAAEESAQRVDGELAADVFGGHFFQRFGLPDAAAVTSTSSRPKAARFHRQPRDVRFVGDVGLKRCGANAFLLGLGDRFSGLLADDCNAGRCRIVDRPAPWPRRLRRCDVFALPVIRATFVGMGQWIVGWCERLSIAALRLRSSNLKSSDFKFYNSLHSAKILPSAAFQSGIAGRRDDDRPTHSSTLYDGRAAGAPYSPVVIGRMGDLPFRPGERSRRRTRARWPRRVGDVIGSPGGRLAVSDCGQASRLLGQPRRLHHKAFHQCPARIEWRGRNAARTSACKWLIVDNAKVRRVAPRTEHCLDEVDRAADSEGERRDRRCEG